MKHRVSAPPPSASRPEGTGPQARVSGADIAAELLADTVPDVAPTSRRGANSAPGGAPETLRSSGVSPVGERGGGRSPAGSAPPPVTVVDLAPAVLTVTDLARLLRVGRRAAYGLVARGEVPGVRRVGRSIRVSREAVERWLASGAPKPG